MQILITRYKEEDVVAVMNESNELALIPLSDILESLAVITDFAEQEFDAADHLTLKVAHTLLSNAFKS